MVYAQNFIISLISSDPKLPVVGSCLQHVHKHSRNS